MSWTIMIYMAGDNSTEECIADDLNTLESVAVGGDVSVVVLADRAEGFSTDYGDWTDTRLAEVTYDGGDLLVTTLDDPTTSLGELNMGDAQTLTDFIDAAATANPADNYALFLWDHGYGLMGACTDEASDDQLSLEEISSAIAASGIGAVDLIGFDACNMGLTEVAFQVQDVADYFLASQDYVPWDGYDYAAMLETLAINPDTSPALLGVTMVDDYIDYYGPNAKGITQSVVDLSGLEELEYALDVFVWAATSAGPKAMWQLTRAAAEAHDFTAGYRDSHIDLGDFMDLVIASNVNPVLRTAATMVADQLDLVVLANGGTVDNSGLSIYLPAGLDRVMPEYGAETYAFLDAVHWDSVTALL